MKNSPKKVEITIQQASDDLGVSERMVLNYVKSKEIAALKVGKKWFLKKASVDAFKQRHGFVKFVEGSAKLQTQAEARNGGKKKLTDLVVFRLLQDNLPRYAPLIESEQLISLRNRLIELVAGGFYSFGARNKIHYYLQARSTLGAMIAHLYFTGLSAATGEKIQLCNFLEQDLMPAFASLIRRFEKM